MGVFNLTFSHPRPTQEVITIKIESMKEKRQRLIRTMGEYANIDKTSDWTEGLLRVVDEMGNILEMDNKTKEQAKEKAKKLDPAEVYGDRLGVASGIYLNLVHPNDRFDTRMEINKKAGVSQTTIKKKAQQLGKII